MTIVTSFWQGCARHSMKLPGEATQTVPAVAGLIGLCLLPSLVRGQDIVDLRTLDLPRWKLEREFRLGSVDGEHDAFVGLGRIRVDARGTLYVLDVGLPALRVFDAAGRFVRQIGGEGDGPGEYRAPMNFGFSGDTIWVVDGATGRVALFAPDGRVLEDFRLEREAPGVEPPLPIEVLGPDDFLAVTPAGPDRVLREHGVGRVFFEQSIVRMNRSGTRADTLATYVVEPGVIITQADAQGRSMIPYRPIRQQSLFSFYAERGELAKIDRTPATRSDRGEFRVTVRRQDGAVVADRRFVYRPVPLPQSTKDSIRAEMRSRFEQAKANLPPGRAERHAERMEVALRHLELPDFLPPVSQGMAIDRSGTRWTAREAPPAVTMTIPGPIAASFLITDEALNPLAIVESPPGAVALAELSGPDRVWFIERDDLDVQYMVRYRIRRE